LTEDIKNQSGSITNPHILSKCLPQTPKLPAKISIHKITISKDWGELMLKFGQNFCQHQSVSKSKPELIWWLYRNTHTPTNFFCQAGFPILVSKLTMCFGLLNNMSMKTIKKKKKQKKKCAEKVERKNWQSLQ
jgi:hypothetical protein